MDEVASLSTVDADDVTCEWRVVGMNQALLGESLSCVCGKIKLKTCFIIENIVNGNVIDNVGSDCVRHFDNEEMDDTMRMLEQGLKKRVPWNARFGTKTYAETYELCKHARDPIMYAMDNNSFNYSRKWGGYIDYANMRKRCEM